jgi:glycosyltransferase involved in cell wall biosynthesis
MSEPKVSVLLTTYNQERYIAHAVHSALAQRTDFAVEIVIGEDCSTDATRAIVVDLVQQHPDRLRLLLHERNGGGPNNVATALEACRGEYVAMLEGDDYWTDPLKLQKQVAALETNAHWSMCFHPAKLVREGAPEPLRLFPPDWPGREATVDDLFERNFIGTCSMVFRRRVLPELPEWHREIIPGDWAIAILCADRGPIGFLPEPMAAYRVHGQGLWTAKPLADRHAEIFRMLSRVDHHFGGKYSRRIDAYRNNIVRYLAERVERLERQAFEGLPRIEEGQAIAPFALRAKGGRRRRQPARSAVYRLSRAIMRPVEQVGRKVGVAMGIRLKAG